MRYCALFTLILAAGCEVAVNGGTGAQNPQNPPPATAGTPAATTTPTANPTPAPVDTSPGIHAPRKLPSVGPATTNPNLSPTTATRAPTMNGPNDFGSGTQTPDSFTGQIYFIPAASQKLPDFSTMQPSGVLYTRNFDIGPRNFDKGFPGVDSRFEWFAIRYTGTINVAAAGAYNLKITSDDGANLYIDGNKVVDNDGQHAPKTATGSVTLTAGAHTFQLDYFQGPRYQVALQVSVTPPGGTEKVLTTSF